MFYPFATDFCSLVILTVFATDKKKKKNNITKHTLARRLGDARVDWGDGGISDLDEGSASFSSSARRQYPAMFAWKLLDAEMAAARGGRGVEAIFEAGAPRRRSTTTAVG